MKFIRKLNLVFCLFFFSLSLQDVFAQDFSSIDTDLQELEKLIKDTIVNTELQQILLEDLKTNLNENGILIAGYEKITTEQEILLGSLREQLNEMSKTYRMQSALSAKFEAESKFWRTFTLIAVPAAAILSGGIVWILCR